MSYPRRRCDVNSGKRKVKLLRLPRVPLPAKVPPTLPFVGVLLN